MKEMEQAPQLEEQLKPLAEELSRLLPDRFKGLVAYRGGLIGELGAAAPVVHVLVLVDKVDVEMLDRIRPSVSKWGRRLHIDPIFITPDEIKNSVDVFPVEFLNIKSDHIFIGEHDPFPEVEIYDRALRRQVEEDLKAKRMWLRESFLRQGNHPRMIHVLLVEHFVALQVLIRSLLYLKGKEMPRSEEEALRQMAEAYGADFEVLKEVADLRHKRPKMSQAEMEGLLQRYLDTIGKIIEEVERMAEGRPHAE